MNVEGGECVLPADIVFVVDDSSSVTSNDFATMLDFVEEVIEIFDNIEESGVRYV
eukprot:m.361101 g.361101  ORF g.361101 m.361101 type:complete len:55 (+) comp133228_c0_seq1:44-208(+)